MTPDARLAPILQDLVLAIKQLVEKPQIKFSARITWRARPSSNEANSSRRTNVAIGWSLPGSFAT